MATNKTTLNVILDKTQAFESRGRQITLGGILDAMASMDEARETPRFLDEDGEIDTSSLVAYLINAGYWRLMALADDNARKAAKLPPSRVVGAALGDVSPEAAKEIAEAKEKAAKLAGIEVKAPKAKPAPAPAKDLEAQIAKLMAENATLKAEPVKEPSKAPKAKKAAKAKPAPEMTQAEAAKALVAMATPEAKPLVVAALAEAAKPAPAPKAEAPAPSMADLLAWFKADTSRDTKAARVAFPMISAVKLANCYRASKV
jgi:hypothetical protein